VARQQQRKDSDARRGTSSERGYDALWRSYRRAYLMRYPLCRDCMKQGRVVVATEVHHIVALRDGGDRLDAANCMPLCHSCHSTRTAKGE
jgi:5-methylcytosine-specific restriction enzyme A